MDSPDFSATSHSKVGSCCSNSIFWQSSSCSRNASELDMAGFQVCEPLGLREPDSNCCFCKNDSHVSGWKYWKSVHVYLFSNVNPVGIHVLLITKFLHQRLGSLPRCLVMQFYTCQIPDVTDFQPKWSVTVKLSTHFACIFVAQLLRLYNSQKLRANPMRRFSMLSHREVSLAWSLFRKTAWNWLLRICD